MYATKDTFRAFARLTGAAILSLVVGNGVIVPPTSGVSLTAPDELAVQSQGSRAYNDNRRFAYNEGRGRAYNDNRRFAQADLGNYNHT